MSKTINTINFTKDRALDQSLISAANQFIARPENDGFSATSLLRKFFKRCMELVNTGQIRIANGEPQIGNGNGGQGA